MTFYTAVPLEFVFEGIEHIKPPIQVEVMGIKMEVMPVTPGVGQIVRLLNCSLDDYLNPALAPGTIIAYSASDT